MMRYMPATQSDQKLLAILGAYFELMACPNHVILQVLVLWTPLTNCSHPSPGSKNG